MITVHDNYVAGASHASYPTTSANVLIRAKLP